MAIQAQMYHENLGLSFMGGGVSGGSQDWFFMSNNNQNNFNNNFSNTNNNNMSFNGYGFNDIQQHKQQQQQEQVLLQLQQQYMLQNQQQRSNNNVDDLVFCSTKNNCASPIAASTTTTTESDYQLPMNISPCFVDQVEKQRQEIDRFITLQNERLKMALQEQRKQQLSTIMRKLEAKAMQLLTQKDEEIARATKRTIELEDIITKLEIENQEWQTSAIENEAMVVSLNNTLEQLNEPTSCSSSTSRCNVNTVGVINNNKEETEVVLCKVCKSEKCCILLLPCRHLCCCKECAPFVDACPICKVTKMTIIEALIS